MKTVLVTLIVWVAVADAGRAQDIRWGFQGGMNLSGGIARETGVVIKGKPAPGYALGVLADVPLANPRWSIRPVLSYQHEASNADIFDDNTFIRVNYFNLPIDVIYHPDFAEKRWVFGLGPWFAYALSGKYTQDGYTWKINFGSSDLNDAHHLDFGLEALAGFQLKPDMMLTAKLDWGFKDVSAQPDFVTIFTRSFAVNFVYWMPNAIHFGAGAQKK
ncbi:MAG TPA: porin family protein [Puia sp.]|nr:porin family protein [Puia sp.]